ADFSRRMLYNGRLHCYLPVSSHCDLAVASHGYHGCRAHAIYSQEFAPRAFRRDPNDSFVLNENTRCSYSIIDSFESPEHFVPRAQRDSHSGIGNVHRICNGLRIAPYQTRLDLTASPRTSLFTADETYCILRLRAT